MGMATIVMNAGKALSMSCQLMRPTSVSMRYPTNSKTPQVAALVTMPKIGERKAHAAKRAPTTRLEKPVRAPATMPVADSA